MLPRFLGDIKNSLKSSRESGSPQEVLKFFSRNPALLPVLNKVMNFWVPYTGALGAKIIELGPGYCKTQLRERRAIRNHFNSVHALALANLGEMTSGLAQYMKLPRGIQGIVTELTTKYFKKARGTLTCECKVEDFPEGFEGQRVVCAKIHNESGELVAEVSATWIMRSNVKKLIQKEI